ncbi:beta-lactamase hydrolase domain-containing protein [Caballeronia glebae]
MVVYRLTEELTVSPQITIDDVETLHKLGFRSIVCHRPDGARRSGLCAALRVMPRRRCARAKQCRQDDLPAALGGRTRSIWGAGMHEIQNAAGVIKANMPLGLGGTLTDQQAWDVAMFMDSHERPQDPRFVGSVEATRTKYQDSLNFDVGKSVNGHVLGSPRRPATNIRASSRMRSHVNSMICFAMKETFMIESDGIKVLIHAPKRSSKSRSDSMNVLQADVVVIRAGPAGINVFIVLESGGFGVLLADRGPLGTTCARFSALSLVNGIRRRRLFLQVVRYAFR